MKTYYLRRHLSASNFTIVVVYTDIAYGGDTTTLVREFTDVNQAIDSRPRTVRNVRYDSNTHRGWCVQGYTDFSNIHRDPEYWVPYKAYWLHSAWGAVNRNLLREATIDVATHSSTSNGVLWEPYQVQALARGEGFPAAPKTNHKIGVPKGRLP